ncbi:MAG: rRNA maturation RNase YbeY [Verrucomicrobia bacterium]|nr:rRNA maturation RNase YbeY [Verrucomicrobiota bacterium]
MIVLHLRNRRGARPIDVRLLRRIVQTLLREAGVTQAVDLGIYLVGIPEITRLNEVHLHHAGPTDVITFDHAEGGRWPGLHGEVFVCVEEAVRQARRYRTSWQAETVRYVVHGLLHLLGYDDQQTTQRRRMRRAENRFVRTLAHQFAFSELGRRRSPVRGSMVRR